MNYITLYTLLSLSIMDYRILYIEVNRGRFNMSSILNSDLLHAMLDYTISVLCHHLQIFCHCKPSNFICSGSLRIMQRVNKLHHSSWGAIHSYL